MLLGVRLGVRLEVLLGGRWLAIHDVLLVHGPLQATAMAEAARSLLGGAVVPGSFDYRLLAPLFDHQGMVVTATRSTEYIEPGIDDAGQDQIVTQARDRTGRPTAQGRWVCRG